MVCCCSKHICMKRQKSQFIKSICFSDVTNCVFCLQIDPESFIVFSTKSDDLFKYAEPSSTAEIGYTYFKCVSSV